MSEREEIINLIRNEFDPRPNLGKADYPGFEWDDGAGRIADAVLADVFLAIKNERERCANIAESYEGTLAHPATVSHCRAGIAAAIRGDAR